MEDVFRAYGNPIAEEEVDDLYKQRGDNRVLYTSRKKGRLSYDEYGIGFWFDSGQIVQIVIVPRSGPYTPPPWKVTQPQPRASIDIPIDRRYPRWIPLIRIHRLWDYVKPVWTYILAGLALMSVVVFTLKDQFGRLYYRRRPLPEGRLLIVNDPTGAEIGNINVWYQARLLRKRRLIVGSGEDADIRLPHESVKPRHARLSARRLEGGVTTYIEQLATGDIAVNDVRKPVMQLRNNAEVRVGDFLFRYEMPTEYRQVQVRHKDGKVLEGVPTSWDINASGFTLLAPRAESWLEARFIRFDKLKGVYFTRDWDEDVRKKLLKSRDLHKHPASVHFKDDEVVEGYLIGDYCGLSRRFFFFPQDQSGDTVYILVEPSSVSTVVRQDAATANGSTGA